MTPSFPQGVLFPGSLCHGCVAPPRYVASDRGAVFVFCPLLKRYPAQPVVACETFQPRPSDAE